MAKPYIPKLQERVVREDGVEGSVGSLHTDLAWCRWDNGNTGYVPYTNIKPIGVKDDKTVR